MSTDYNLKTQKTLNNPEISGNEGNNNMDTKTNSNNKPSQASQKATELICDICYNTDEFNLCRICFEKFNSLTYKHKLSVDKNNDELQHYVNDFFEKRKNDMEKYNRLVSKKSNIENLKRLINLSKTRIIKTKENIDNIKIHKKNIENKIKSIEENICDINKSILLHKKNNKSLAETIEKKNSHKHILVKNFFKKLLNIIFCPNKIYLFSEIFEKDEYVLPTIEKDVKKKKYFDDFSNILSTEIKSHEKYFSLDEHKKHINMEKYLKTKDSIINYNMNPFPFMKFSDMKPGDKDFYGKCYIYEVNNYVHKILLFVKSAGKFLNVKMPCNIESEYDMLITDSFDFCSELKKLIIKDNDYSNFNESETFSSYLSLDKNLIFLKDILHIKSKLTSHFIPSFYNSNNFSSMNKEYYECNNHNNNNDANNNYNNANNPFSFSFSGANVINNNKMSNNSASSNEFNSDFLNMIPFFNFCGEPYEIKKFSHFYDSIKSDKQERIEDDIDKIIIRETNDEDLGEFVLINNYFG